MIADRIAAGLQSGWSDFTSPATPATCGHDIDVPDSKAYEAVRSSPSTPVALTTGE